MQCGIPRVHRGSIDVGLMNKLRSSTGADSEGERSCSSKSEFQRVGGIGRQLECSARMESPEVVSDPGDRHLRRDCGVNCPDPLSVSLQRAAEWGDGYLRGLELSHPVWERGTCGED